MRVHPEKVVGTDEMTRFAEKLPETYDRALFTEKCNSVFETMLSYASLRA